MLACLATTCTWLVLASAFTEYSLHLRLMPLYSAVTLAVSLYQARQGRAPWLALAAGILGTYDAVTTCLFLYYELTVLLPPYYVLSLGLTALCHQAVLVLHALLVLVALPATRTAPAPARHILVLRAGATALGLLVIRTVLACPLTLWEDYSRYGRLSPDSILTLTTGMTWSTVSGPPLGTARPVPLLPASVTILVVLGVLAVVPLLDLHRAFRDLPEADPSRARIRRIRTLLSVAVVLLTAQVLWGDWLAHGSVFNNQRTWLTHVLSVFLMLAALCGLWGVPGGPRDPRTGRCLVVVPRTYHATADALAVWRTLGGGPLRQGSPGTDLGDPRYRLPSPSVTFWVSCLTGPGGLVPLIKGNAAAQSEGILTFSYLVAFALGTVTCVLLVTVAVVDWHLVIGPLPF